MNFISDNTSHVSEQVISRLLKINNNHATPYGGDEETLLLIKNINKLFGKDVIIFPTQSGTAANALGLATSLNPTQSIVCHTKSHINTKETGAIEFFTSGSRLMGIDQENDRISPKSFSDYMQLFSESMHEQTPKIISLTNLSDWGTCYTVEEIKEISKIAKKHDMLLHLDGARLANAIIHTKDSLTEMTYQSGVDILSFGFCKNGAMNADLVIFFDEDKSKGLIQRAKRGGCISSKMRYISAQVNAMLEEDLWLKNATNANNMALLLEKYFISYGIKTLYPVEGNEVFIKTTKNTVDYWNNNNVKFSSQISEDNKYLVRFVTSFSTTKEEVELFGNLLAINTKKSAILKTI